MVIKWIVFILHTLTALFLAFVATKCSFITEVFTESFTKGYLVLAEGTCKDFQTKSCFFGIPEAYDIGQRGLEWNLFALLALFEWISASFALGHLYYKFNASNQTSQIKLICLIWNVIGIWLITHPMSLLQRGISLLSLLIATSSQYFPDDEVVMHYTEYCTTASLLFVGVLILYIPNPQSWTVIVGFTGIILCNLTGVAAHLCKLETADEGGWLPFYDLDWGKIGNHFKLHLMHAWTGLLLALMSIVYVGRDDFMNADIPWWVRLILFNLIITFTLFGVWATFCYIMADQTIMTERLRLVGEKRENKDFQLWAVDRLSSGLTILSALAKLPIAFTIIFGLINMNKCDINS
jgi:hypothetical protein